MENEASNKKSVPTPDLGIFCQKFQASTLSKTPEKEKAAVPISWSSQNVLAFGSLPIKDNKPLCAGLQILAYESMLSSEKEAVSDKMHDCCLPISIAMDSVAKYRFAGLKWNGTGNALATWDEMGTLQILRASCTNTYRQLFCHNFKEPIVGLAWLPTERAYKYNPETGVSRRPLLGPVNPFGELALVGLTRSGRVLLVYQQRGNDFRIEHRQLPFPNPSSTIALAEVLMGPARSLLFVLKPTHEAHLIIVRASIPFEDAELFRFSHLRSPGLKVPLQGFVSQVEDDNLIVAMFGSCPPSRVKRLAPYFA
ncbi:hypothetical protein DSO57_1021660 [Entomophthora muscae]|uniref:Uncharacterized protein n=1 Tax=Entomophthora muscae TaxID=34485 RepID=A0ACC2SGG1_9FUNG|nr:hypothetical protein DSO57_1021660 [Entomophthora muscae]